MTRSPTPKSPVQPAEVVEPQFVADKAALDDFGAENTWIEPLSPEVRMKSAFERLRAAHLSRGGLDYKRRMSLLKALERAVLGNKLAFVDAVRSDFGHRSPVESVLLEVFVTVEEIRHSRAHLRDWMDAEEVEVPFYLAPATARIEYQPKGVVGIIAPWNYPLQLALAPVVAAVAAGNRFLLKPSEYTPQVSDLLAKLVSEVFAEEEGRVVVGGPSLGAAFTGLPFDHLFFTGSPRVGKLVMKAASDNLVPVTLELGGKSAAIVHPSYDMARATTRIAWGKCVNAGQTCLAPDYAILHAEQVGPFEQGMKAAATRMFPRLADNPDYTAIINEQHYRRLQDLLVDARDKGARIVEVNPGGEALDPARRKIPLTLVFDTTPDMAIMQEEIFGPLMPVKVVASIDEAIAHINAQPTALGMYYFDNSRRRCDSFVARTASGGVTLNDVMLHFQVPEAPFGGVGNAGLGAYHGRSGFVELSHRRTVFKQARWCGINMFNPPYGGLIDKALKALLRG